jgi:hypothetical protein
MGPFALGGKAEGLPDLITGGSTVMMGVLLKRADGDDIRRNISSSETTG